MRRLLAALLCAALLLPAALIGAEGDKTVGQTAEGETIAAPAVQRPKPQPWAKTGDIATEGFPALTEEGFLPEGEPEYVFEDAAQGVWRYASQTLRVVIHRVETHEKSRKQRNLIAEIFVREGSEGFRMAAHAPGHLMDNQDRYKEKQHQIAINHGMVFALNTDFFIYRVSRRASAGSSYGVGVVIRDHELLADFPIQQGSTRYPPLDMLAMFEDGDMQAYAANELTGRQLLEIGARDVLSFGPVLVRDGKLGTFDEIRGATPQPRVGIGMFQPGHYLAIIAEGRIKQSGGLSSREFAELFQSLGCGMAFNLDGGKTSSMVFMGKQLNQITAAGVFNNARPQHEVMGIGSTELLKDMAEQGK